MADDEKEGIDDPAFLMEVMEAREEIEDLEQIEALQELKAQYLVKQSATIQVNRTPSYAPRLCLATADSTKCSAYRTGPEPTGCSKCIRQKSALSLKSFRVSVFEAETAGSLKVQAVLSQHHCISGRDALQDMSAAFAKGQLAAANEAKIRLRYVIRILQAIEQKL